MLVFLLKISTKLHCKYAFFRILTFFFHSNGRDLFTDAESAESYLSSISPDKGTSCICDNKINPNPDYDLQIIVPVHNVEKYLEECIESILSQETHYLFLVKIINDGSTDNSRSILTKYEEVSNVLIVDQQNKGLSGARNTGLRDIDARYVMFVDSDDVLYPDCIEKLMLTADRGDYDIVDGSYDFFREDTILRRYVHQSNNVNYDKGVLHGQPWGKVYKAQLFKRVKFPENYWFEDTVNRLILFRLADKHTTIQDIVYHYRDNQKSITNTAKASVKSLDTYWVTKRLLFDSNMLDLKLTQSFYEQMLEQIVYNARRLIYMQDVNRVFAAHLVAMNEVMHGMCPPTFSSNSPQGRFIEKCLQQCDYKRLHLAILFLWN